MPSILSKLADDSALMDALREVLERQFDTKREELGKTDLELGQIVRARLEGKRAIDAALKEIGRYRSFEVAESKTNPGA